MRLFLVAALILGLACAGSAPPSGTGESSARSSSTESELAVLEVVIRDLMQHDTDQARTARTSDCFVGFENQGDPPLPFIERLASGCANVGPASEMPGPPWRGDANHPTRIRFEVSQVNWVSDHQAEVVASYHCGSLCAAAYQYRVEWADSG